MIFPLRLSSQQLVLPNASRVLRVGKLMGGGIRGSQDVQLYRGTDASGALGLPDLFDPLVNLSTSSLPRAECAAILNALTL